MNNTTTPPSFCWPVRVYWEDTDAGGVVYYANYLKFFERARTEWLRRLGLEQHALRESTGGVFVVSEAAIKYHRSARLDDALTINLRLQQAGKASVVFVQQAWREPRAASVGGENNPVGLGAVGADVAAETAPHHQSQAAQELGEQKPAHQQEPQRELLAEATIRVGWVKAETMQPTRMPQQVLQALAAAEAGSGV